MTENIAPDILVAYDHSVAAYFIAEGSKVVERDNSPQANLTHRAMSCSEPLGEKGWMSVNGRGEEYWGWNCDGHEYIPLPEAPGSVKKEYWNRQEINPLQKP